LELFIFRRETRGRQQSATNQVGGEPESQKYSNDFIAWATRRGESPDDAAYNRLYVDNVLLASLAATGDKRAKSIFTRGLALSDYLLRYSCATGLLAIHDSASIPGIEAAAKDAPKGVDMFFAMALLGFGTKEGDEAAARVLSDKSVLPELIANRDRQKQKSQMTRPAHKRLQ
jgi:hypothetical protein